MLFLRRYCHPVACTFHCWEKVLQSPREAEFGGRNHRYLCDKTKFLSSHRRAAEVQAGLGVGWALLYLLARGGRCEAQKGMQPSSPREDQVHGDPEIDLLFPFLICQFENSLSGFSQTCFCSQHDLLLAVIFNFFGVGGLVSISFSLTFHLILN